MKKIDFKSAVIGFIAAVCILMALGATGRTGYKEYKVVLKPYSKYLVKEVNKDLSEGWQPVGGVGGVKVFL